MRRFSSASFFACAWASLFAAAASSARRFFSAAATEASSALRFFSAAASSAILLFSELASSALRRLSAAISAALFAAGGAAGKVATAGDGGAAFGPAPPPPKKEKTPPDLDVSSSPKKYLDPDLVLTTELLVAAPTIVEVVTGSPSLKAPDPLMNPDTAPSSSSFHLEMVGTPRGALAAAAGGADPASGAAPAACLGAPPPSPNSEMVGRPLTGGTLTGVPASGVAFAFDAAFFFLGCAIFCAVNEGATAPRDGRTFAGCSFFVGSFFLAGAAAEAKTAFAASAALLISASRASRALRSSACCLSSSVTAGLSLAINSFRAASVKR